MASEDSRLPELQAVAARELQASGFTVYDDPNPIPIREEDRQGKAGGAAIRGNLQTLDSNGMRCAFYLRPAGVSPLIPAWLYDLALAAYDVQDDVRVAVVVEAPASADDEREARDCGAALYEISIDDGTLVEKVPPAKPMPERTSHDFERNAQTVRQAIVSGATLLRKTIEQQYGQLGTGEEARKSRKRLRARYEKWETWRERRLAEWRRISRRYSFDELEQLGREIEQDLEDEEPRN
jgi:hypothetical protein